MGTINYGLSEYITLGYNCNTNYANDDFWEDEDEQREFEIKYLYDEVKQEVDKYNFEYFKVNVCPGYYEGFYIDIEFVDNIWYWQDKREANKEITKLKKLLINCAKAGLVACYPGWVTGYASYPETLNLIHAAVVRMRQDIHDTPTLRQT